MTNNQQLIKLMKSHNLSAADVALLLSRSYKTVYAWKYGQNPMPDPLLELLKLKISLSSEDS